MDEYLTEDEHYIDETDRLSFRGFMNREVYAKLDPELIMPPAQRIFPDPESPERISVLIHELGGVDLVLGGIGITGHLAFNEPQPELSVNEFAQKKTRVLNISPETRTANAIGDLGGAVLVMPHKCITVGMSEILSARKIRMGVFRDWHRAVVREAAYGEICAGFPATLLQQHSDAAIFLNNIAAEQAF